MDVGVSVVDRNHGKTVPVTDCPELGGADHPVSFGYKLQLAPDNVGTDCGRAPDPVHADDDKAAPPLKPIITA
jgi:hypothetical protein